MAESSNTETKPRLPWHVDNGPIRKWLASATADGEEAAAWERIGLWDKMVNDHGVLNVRKEGKVGVIELAYAPKANAIVPPMYKMFVDAMDDLSADDDIWTIVITGQGKNFSSGGYVGHDAFYAGLDAGHDGTRGEPIRRTLVEMFQPIPLSIARCEKPTIAAVNGPVMAEAIDIALTPDLRTGSSNTQFRFSFAATGNTAYTGAAWSLPKLVGLAKAREYLYTADWVEGPRAYESGLINYLYEPENFMDKTMELANKIASLPPITLRLIKKEITIGQNNTFERSLDIYSMIEPIVQSTDDHMDAENAVVEKRPPVVRGH